MANRPNIFILGAGKCGTTTLFELLSQHQDIHASPIKEPSFFCSHFQVVSNPIDYFNLFKTEKASRMEASHVYLSNHTETAPVLRGLCPNAKFVLILRDPRARAYSLYRHMRRALHASDGLPLEILSTFHSALLEEPQRLASKNFLETNRQYFWNFMYCNSSMYDKQISEYLSIFEREQFHALSLAELSRDPRGALDDITNFLGLDRLDPASARLDLRANIGTQASPPCAASMEIMERAFEGLTERTDRLIGRKLDWSL